MTGDVAVFVAEIRAQLAAGQRDAAFRVFLSLNDALVAAAPGELVAITFTDPGRAGSAQFDALVGGLVEHVLGAAGLPVPDWTNAPSRTLTQEWFVDDSPYAREHDRSAAPRSFAHRNVYLAASELESA